VGRRFVLTLIACCAAAFGLGALSQALGLLPVGSLLRARSLGTYDADGRLVAYPGKIDVACPPQTGDAAVILAIGQSNIANSGSTRTTTAYPDRVLNYFQGKCYVAASPLLGASGEGGEFLTPMADRLVKNGRYRTVILVPLGLSSSPVARWQRDGDLNEQMLAALAGLPGGYKVTQVLWLQGESDLAASTSAKVYRASFLSLLESLRRQGVDAPVFIAIATKCRAALSPGNPVAAAQQGLVSDGIVRLGADTDRLAGDADRRDGCHFNEAGQNKVAASFADAIEASAR
jgi:lysophospholipase L1-like esterase